MKKENFIFNFIVPYREIFSYIYSVDSNLVMNVLILQLCELYYFFFLCIIQFREERVKEEFYGIKIFNRKFVLVSTLKGSILMF